MKKIKNRLIYALFSLFLITVILPMTMISAADGSQDIEVAVISDLSFQTIGSCPDFTASLPENANYHFASKEELDNIFGAGIFTDGIINGIGWFNRIVYN